MRMPLAGGDLDGQPVGGRRERTGPPRVVRAGRVVGEVEVEDGRALVGVESEIRPLHRVDEVAPTAIRRLSRRLVLEGEEETTAVALVPRELELVLETVALESDDCDGGEGERASRADGDVHSRRLDVVHGRGHAPRRVVVVEAAPGKGRPVVLR